MSRPGDAMAYGGDSLYAWQCQEPDGRWSMIAGAMEPGVVLPLIHRDLGIIRRLTEVAEAHAGATGQPLRLARFELAEVLE